MADSRLRVTVEGNDQLSPQLRSLESGVIRFVGAVSASLAALKLGAAPILAAAQFERELANVAKTTGFMSKRVAGGIGELDRLGTALQDISLRVGTSAVDLAKIAAAAGQQGLGRFGVAGVVAFTDSVSRMANVLDLTAEESATAVGKIVNIFKIPLLDIERTVSTINEITNRSTANGEELIDTIKRVGDAAGSLNLEQTAALGATGLDFGLTPEVIGTALNKVFSSFLEDANRYAEVVKGVALDTGEILDGSADQWIKAVRKNGLSALRAYLAGLRQLDEQSQQTALVKLTGGGRIGALFNKLIQDTTDTVLRRNLEAAQDGAQGFSAIEEQARVTQTLTEQSKVLMNSLVRLGTEAASDLLPKLTAITAQLSQAIQAPAFKAFVAAAIDALGELVFGVVDLVKFVASLNVNWENFITVLKVFLSLKAAQAVGSLLSSFSLFGVSLKSISSGAAKSAAELDKVEKSAKGAGAALAASSSAGVKGWLAQVTGMDVWLERQRRIKAATEAHKVALEDLKKAEIARQAAITQVSTQSTSTGQAKVVSQRAAQASKAERAALETVAKAATAAETKVILEQSARLQRAESESAARRLAIEQSYQVKRKAILATGTETGLKALRAEKTQLLAEEESYHGRSTRSIQAYYARRLAAQQAASAQEIQLARTAVAQKLVAERTAQRQAASQSGAQGAANIALTAATGAVVAAQSRVDILGNAVKNARTAISGIGAAVRGLAGIVATAGRVIAGGFFWVSILVTIVDLTVGLDKLGGVVQKITDFFGFSSKAARDAASAQRELAEASRVAAAEYDDLVAAYRQRLNPATGQLDPTALQAEATLLDTSDSTEKRAEALSKLADIARGAQAEIQKASSQIAEDFSTAIADVEKEVVRLTAIYNREVANRDRALAQHTNPEDQRALSEAFDAELAKIRSSIDATTKKLDQFKKSGVEASKESARAAKDLAAVGATLAPAFSPAAFEGLRDLALPLAAAAEEAKKAKDAFIQAASVDAPLNADKPADGNLERLKLAASQADVALTAAREKLRLFVVEQSSAKGLSEDAKGSLLLLLEVARLQPDKLSAVFAALSTQPASALTSAGAPPVANPASGNRTVNFKSTRSKEESEATKLARARLALAKSELEALNRINAEANTQQLDAERRRYEQGLISVKDYYDSRLSIQQRGVDAEVQLKQRELEAIDFEIETAKKAKQKVELVRLEADRLRVAGEIVVLSQQRGALVDASINDAADDLKDFKQRINQEINDLVADGVISESATEGFSRNLDGMQEDYQEFLNKLRASGQGQLADQILQGLTGKSLREALKPLEIEFDNLSEDLANRRTDIQNRLAEGALTTLDANAEETSILQSQLPLLEAKLNIIEETVRQKLADGVITQRQAADELRSITESRLALAALRAEQNSVARDLNKNFVDALANGLKDITDRTKRASEVVNDILNNIKKTILDAFVDNFAENVAGIFDMSGDGGLGGFIASALTGKPVGSKKDRGQSKSTPLYVEDVNGAPGVDGLLPTTDEIVKDPEGTFDKLSTGFTELFDSLKGGLSDVIDSLSKAFSSVFGGGSSEGGFLSFIGGLFHEGGIVGKSSKKRLMTPDMLRNAVRYHNGGVPGLSPKEVPAILEKGEAVLTERQQGVVAAAMSSNKQMLQAAASAVKLSVDPAAINMTLGNWLERELARVAATQ